MLLVARSDAAKDASAPRVFVPSHCSPRAVERERRLARLREPAVFEAGGRAWRVRPVAVEPLLPATRAWSRLVLEIAGERAILHCSAALLTVLVGQAFPTLTLADVDPDVAALVIEDALGPLLARLEGAGLGPVRILEVDARDAAPGGGTIGLLASTDGIHDAPIILSHALASPALEAWFEGLAFAPRRMDDIKVRLALRVGAATLTLAEMRRLTIGDVLVMQRTLLTHGKLVCVAGEAFARTATQTPGGAALDGALIGHFPQLLEDYRMAAGAAESPDIVGNVRDAQVRVVFELGRLDMTIRDIETIGAGYVFDLGKAAAPLVEIIAGGRRIGTGEIVRFADSIGVRITSLSP